LEKPIWVFGDVIFHVFLLTSAPALFSQYASFFGRGQWLCVRWSWPGMAIPHQGVCNSAAVPLARHDDRPVVALNAQARLGNGKENGE
jgi:hypothetical protein